MYYRLLQLLNVKQHESALVRKLFTVQFFIGIATAFLFVDAVTMFIRYINQYGARQIPLMFLLSAALLFVFNKVYAYAEERVSPPRLLEGISFWAAFSILLFGTVFTFFPFRSMPLVLVSWYLVVYMLLGYAFWGLSSIMFNVRESKRLFSIVGAGDIPAKILGYAIFGALYKITKSDDLVLLTVIPLAITFLLQRRYRGQGFIKVAEQGQHHEHTHHLQGNLFVRFFKQFFTNRLIFYIALLSLVSYIAFAFIDYGFLADLKAAKENNIISSFIIGLLVISRVLAMLVKFIFSSRMITRIGLSNVLLITPVLLLIIDGFVLVATPESSLNLYLFGGMVVLAEVLRSTIQEPVYFILFQPLKPHDRLRGHLVAKGYTLPFALFAVGLFLYLITSDTTSLPISLIAEFLVGFLVLWVASVFFIKKQYHRTLVSTLNKGYFTGAELFLSDAGVTRLLLEKMESNNPVDIIQSLHLLERSGYSSIYTLLLKSLHHPMAAVREFVLSRVVANNMTGALPVILEQLATEENEAIRHALLTAKYFLAKPNLENDLILLEPLPPGEQQAAMLGLLFKNDSAINAMLIDHMAKLIQTDKENRLLVLNIITAHPNASYSVVLEELLQDENPDVYKNAIEAVGKVQDYSLFEMMMAIATKHQAYHSLKRGLQYFGDDVFAHDKWVKEKLPVAVLNGAIKVAGKMNGPHSATFLHSFLVQAHPKCDDVVEALWNRKTTAGTGEEQLHAWVNKKIQQGNVKADFLTQLHPYPNLQLLKNAIAEELQRDVQLLLKAFAMLYDRQQVDRAIELMAIDKQYRMYNAIEVLELIIPARYFTPLNKLVELLNDFNKNEVIPNLDDQLVPYTIIEEILQHNKANFNEWTRSVACYMLPRLKQVPDATVLLRPLPRKDEALYSETRNYVLSILT